MPSDLPVPKADRGYQKRLVVSEANLSNSDYHSQHYWFFKEGLAYLFNRLVGTSA
ncbi:MAG: hypothetical protein HZA00_05310 [Nitrospinae bacterium]|nr:hypothetical protein [Nitrospinota bacterium]